MSRASRHYIAGIPLLAAVILLLIVPEPGRAAGDHGDRSVAAATRGIRAARAAFNAAIERHDIEIISALFLPDYVLVTGRSDLVRDHAANVALWRSTFRADPSFKCERTPDDIEVNAAWGLAQETGHWICTQTVADGPGRYSGVYAAKWQRAADSGWRLQSEVFTTLNCEGPPAACRRPDPATD